MLTFRLFDIYVGLHTPPTPSYCSIFSTLTIALTSLTPTLRSS